MNSITGIIVSKERRQATCLLATIVLTEQDHGHEQIPEVGVDLRPNRHIL